MRHAHTVDSVRAAEAELMSRVPEGTLMRRAASGLAAACAELLGRVYGTNIVLLAGSGDNGGDVLFAGARLARRGARVEAAVLSPQRVHKAGLDAFRGAGGRVVDNPTIERADLLIDGIVGIGGRGGLRTAAADLASRGDRAAVLTVAADVPSGVDASTGRVEGPAVRADLTVTFGTYKPGLFVDPGAQYAGVVVLVDIGLGPHLGPPAAEALQADDVAALTPAPERESNKYRRGVVGISAGSDTYTGAATLVVGGALRGGAGMVRFVSTGRVGDLVRARWPEVIVTASSAAEAGRVQAWVVGPGLGMSDDAEKRLDDVLGTDVPVLIDADGLNVIARRGQLRRSAPTLLTPHAGEAARLLGGSMAGSEVEADRVPAVRELAGRYQATILLKGSTTVVAAASGGPIRVNPTGTSWLATAGSGDVLSGLGGALLAAGLAPLDAGSVAAYVHGLAARRAIERRGRPLTATDVIDELSSSWAALTSGVQPGSRPGLRR